LLHELNSGTLFKRGSALARECAAVMKLTVRSENLRNSGTWLEKASLVNKEIDALE
jgi:hypothetical protein